MGDRDAFAEFVRRRQVALLRLTWALTGSREAGEDLAQATLARMWPRWDKVAAAGDPWPYTQRVAVSLAATWRRRRWRSETAFADVPESAGLLDEADEAGTRVLVARWLDQLPSRQRAVVVLRFLADLPVAETAAAMDCSSGTVKSQTAKARAQPRAIAAAKTVEGRPS